MFHISVTTSSLGLTNCFFLSVDSLFISSLSAFISSSLYWKSRTINLHLEVNKIKSAYLEILQSMRDRMHIKKTLLILSGFVLEVIHCLPEQGDITQVAVLVLKEYTTQKENKPSVRINQVQVTTDQSHSTICCTLLLQGKT